MTKKTRFRALPAALLILGAAIATVGCSQQQPQVAEPAEKPATVAYSEGELAALGFVVEGLLAEGVPESMPATLTRGTYADALDIVAPEAVSSLGRDADAQVLVLRVEGPFVVSSSEEYITELAFPERAGDRTAINQFLIVDPIDARVLSSTTYFAPTGSDSQRSVAADPTPRLVGDVDSANETDEVNLTLGELAGVE